MPQAEKKPKKAEVQKIEKAKKSIKTEVEEGEDAFDFGGMPADVPFNRNIGCGG